VIELGAAAEAAIELELCAGTEQDMNIATAGANIERDRAICIWRLLKWR
jgi:hypothetical protein